MKEIKNFTEQEILKLTDDEINLLIKQKKASEGIKLIERPAKPQLKEIPEKDLTLFSCGLFGGDLLFEEITELQGLIDAINKCNFIGRLSSNSDYDLFSTDKDLFYDQKLKHKYNFNSWDEIKTVKVYSKELHSKIQDDYKYNKKISQEYESLYKEYSDIESQSKWIEQEIWGIVNDIREKYYTLNMYCTKMINEYMPISENNEKIAIGFLEKAYSLNSEEKAYILANYKK